MRGAEADPAGESPAEPAIFSESHPPHVQEYTVDKTIKERLQRLSHTAIYIYELFTFCFVSLKAVVLFSEMQTVVCQDVSALEVKRRELEGR